MDGQKATENNNNQKQSLTLLYSKILYEIYIDRQIKIQ